MSLKNLDGINENKDENKLSNKRYTKQEIYQSIIIAIKRYGKDVTRAEYDNDPEFPHSKTIYRRTGLTFTNLRVRCGGKNTVRQVYYENINQFSSAEAYIIGVLIGDGSVGNTIELKVKDKDFAEEFGEKLCNLLNLEWYGWESNMTEVSTGSYNPDNEKHKKVWRVHQAISGRVKSYFMRYQNLSGKEYMKLFNEFQWHRRELLRGLWDSEGCIKDGGLGFTNSDDYVLKLYMKLVSNIINVEYENPEIYDGLREGYKSQYYGEFRISPAYGKNNNVRQIYIPGKYREKFFYEINPTIKRKKEIFEQQINNPNRQTNQKNYNPDGKLTNIIEKKS